MRLIDADALKERFGKRIKWLEKDVHDQYSLGLFHGCEYDSDLINEIPTIDAVAVVTCKECKYSSYDELFGNRWCNSHSGCRKVNDDDFCCYGERREGADNG